MLTDDTKNKLFNIFFFRKVKHGKSRKFAIPIGLQELTIKKVIKRETKKGKSLVELWIYADPLSEVYGVSMEDLGKPKMSFAPIRCYHVEGNLPIKTFYRRFTTMKPECLSNLSELKGKRFKGLVKHIAGDVTDSTTGRIARDANGRRVKYWTQEIVDVCKVEESIDFDYFNLVDFGEIDIIKPKKEEVPF